MALIDLEAMKTYDENIKGYIAGYIAGSQNGINIKDNEIKTNHIENGSIAEDKPSDAVKVLLASSDSGGSGVVPIGQLTDFGVQVNYMPVVADSYPDDGNSYYKTYEESEGQILQHWVQYEAEENSWDKFLNTLKGE